MRHFLTLSVFSVFVSILFFSLKTNAASLFTGCGSESVEAANVEFETRIVEIVNEQRAAQNLPPMKLNISLSNASRYHAADMDADSYFLHDTHDQVNGELVKQCAWLDRIKVYYPSPRAENIAQGFTSPESVMRAWMNSTGHRNNILGDYREIGVGYYQAEWVQDFGTQIDVYPLIINREAKTTDSTAVSLYIYGNWTQMRLRNDDGTWGDWQDFHPEVAWTLNNAVGLRTVEAELKDSIATTVTSDTIELLAATAPAPTETPAPTPNSPPVPSSIFLPIVRH